MKRPFIYIMSNRRWGTIYVGVTTDLVRRVHLHRTGAIEGFTRKYRLKRLVYFEGCDSIVSAIEREKQLKNWKRDWKIRLIESLNPGWEDLFERIAG